MNNDAHKDLRVVPGIIKTTCKKCQREITREQILQACKVADDYRLLQYHKQTVGDLLLDVFLDELDRDRQVLIACIAMRVLKTMLYHKKELKKLFNAKSGATKNVGLDDIESMNKQLVEHMRTQRLTQNSQIPKKERTPYIYVDDDCANTLVPYCVETCNMIKSAAEETNNKRILEMIKSETNSAIHSHEKQQHKEWQLTKECAEWLEECNEQYGSDVGSGRAKDMKFCAAYKKETMLHKDAKETVLFLCSHDPCGFHNGGVVIKSDMRCQRCSRQHCLYCRQAYNEIDEVGDVIHDEGQTKDQHQCKSSDLMKAREQADHTIPCPKCESPVEVLSWSKVSCCFNIVDGIRCATVFNIKTNNISTTEKMSRLEYSGIRTRDAWHVDDELLDISRDLLDKFDALDFHPVFMRKQKGQVLSEEDQLKQRLHNEWNRLRKLYQWQQQFSWIKTHLVADVLNDLNLRDKNASWSKRENICNKLYIIHQIRNDAQAFDNADKL